MKFVNIVDILVVLIAVTGFTGCNKNENKDDVSQKEKVESPTAVEAISVDKGKILREIEASGVANGIRESYVVSETQGKIEEVNFSLGQWVKKGRLLVKVNSTIQHAAYEQAKRAAAAADLNLNVTQKLFNEGNASDAELKNAQSQATGAKTQLESTQKSFNDCRITAPISGYIAQKELTVEEGNVLAGGRLVTRIVDISSLKATVSVGEMEVGILKRGMEAHIKVPAVDNMGFKGKVIAIAAGSSPSTGSYPVEVSWKNTPKRQIKSGMSVRITIKTEEEDSVILIPSGAVFEEDNKDAIFIAFENKAAIRFIRTGRNVGNRIEISEGLKVGDILITSGVFNLSRGENITVTMINGAGGVE